MLSLEHSAEEIGFFFFRLKKKKKKKKSCIDLSKKEKNTLWISASLGEEIQK